jgi:hypothetical protein
LAYHSGGGSIISFSNDLLILLSGIFCHIDFRLGNITCFDDWNSVKMKAYQVMQEALENQQFTWNTAS